MCRSPDYPPVSKDPQHSDPFTITAFYVRVHPSLFEFQDHEPDFLTLLLNPHPAFSLRRIRLPNHEFVYASKQNVRATTNVMRFQLFDGKTKLLKGAIRIGEDKCEVIPSILGAEIWVSLDNKVAIATKSAKTVCNNKNMIKKKSKLEDIPEEAELRADDGANPEIEEAAIHLEMDLEVLRKAMDMGIWALCLGFGFMVSKSFHHSFRARPTFF
ncbi:hypothetical protein HN51_064570 [Arachis hypogaea]|uniref:Uncharacterized protein n=1 Tax=Arachis hypogaea TaxID=3818 RepID=A0A444ZBE3_ARAHY|nr:uncharacterized protein LOC107638312 [Arachis ipaensis]XP_025645344.1 uncharacterized protein LOC112740872 [Arachis hypogaea]QHO05616.1 uncharacterized protein DS421_14g447720 [Arachis hypogaea]RYR11500.1 hypothetical protein Ahy_B04g069019 [Arachis hypogaea]